MTKANIIDSITRIEVDNGFVETLSNATETKDTLMICYMNLKSMVARVTGESYLEVSKRYD